MDTSNIIIETERLNLKGITLDCRDDIFRYFTSEITVHMFPKPPENIEDTVNFIESSIKSNKAGTNFQVVILHKETQKFLGCGGLHNIDENTPELGIWIKKTAHGNGYGKEAVIALKEWADKNIDYDTYPVAETNYASRRIPEYLNAKIAREYYEINMSGKNQHLLEYRIYHPKTDVIPLD